MNVTSQESQDVSPGSIISQDPSGSVAPGSVISVVTAAPKMTAIENRAGTTLDDFLSYLNKNGMKQGAETKQYSDTVPAGNIVSNTTGSFAQALPLPISSPSDRMHRTVPCTQPAHPLQTCRTQSIQPTVPVPDGPSTPPMRKAIPMTTE